MKLEVLVRHHFGVYLPASIIRRLCAKDNCAASVFEVSQLWPLYRYDTENRSVHWAEDCYEKKWVLGAKSGLFNVGYFVFAMLAIGCAWLAVSKGPKEFISWIYGLNTVFVFIMALGSLAKAESYAMARKRGHEWLVKLNAGPKDEPASKRRSPR